MGVAVNNVGNPNGFRHWTRINGDLVAVEEALHIHNDNAGIDTTAATIYQSDIADLHDAAVQGSTAFVSAAAAVFGQWWTDLLADADAASLQGTLDDPRRSLRAHYLRPVRVAIL